MAKTLSSHELRRLAVESESDPRTVARVVAGGHAKGMVDARIRRVLAANGITPSSSAPDAVRQAAAAMRTGRPFL